MLGCKATTGEMVVHLLGVPGADKEVQERWSLSLLDFLKHTIVSYCCAYDLRPMHVFALGMQRWTRCIE